ncbi:malonyl-ACP O-methyltransferase BioC [Marinobacterium weihaiense]|uniref:Malonyl-[acyl-carrier protein] O-methyltransferase n=1 Tax=Marinobacterium weihaiense TaxID=2851016 RepID=A0ABS6MAZ6_9GAMM|nr:malonyl-ACP O-methyltransferase BioC [Marinobacterium weihaiense]MBV0933440.1 malonyl-ACP O-methyltransferase BioC [Marinobacterium weihaiense]
MQRDKRKVAQAFSRAAESYDSVAQLQRDIADQLLDWLPQQAEGHVLDLGCGTGYAAPYLRERYPQTPLLHLDLAHGMLSFAREQRPVPDAYYLCGDAEQLPLADASVDLIWSSLAVQWCEQPERLLAELARVLKPGGRCLLATLGPDTLHELKQAWAVVDDDVHVNNFIPLTQLLAHNVSLQLVRCETEYKVLRYSRLQGLMHELKALGAHNVNSRRERGLSSRQRLTCLLEAYEQQRQADGMLPATYEVYYLELLKEPQ